MAIDPMQINPSAQQLKLVRAEQKSLERTAFETQLKEAAELETAAPEAAAQQLDAMLKLARLQLLQGLFSLEDNEEQADLFAALQLNSAVAEPAAARHQADRIYRQLQPTLQESAGGGRPEIEQLIDRVAEQVSLAPELIRSVVAVESDFQPQAVSHAGAQGLMQLMPATAAELGVQDSFNPQQNLLGGSRYLKQLLVKYDGDLDKALAAYNWGQGNVDRKGLEQMPEETRQYLFKVKGLLATNA